MEQCPTPIESAIQTSSHAEFACYKHMPSALPWFIHLIIISTTEVPSMLSSLLFSFVQPQRISVGLISQIKNHQKGKCMPKMNLLVRYLMSVVTTPSLLHVCMFHYLPYLLFTLDVLELTSCSKWLSNEKGIVHVHVPNVVVGISVTYS